MDLNEKICITVKEACLLTGIGRDKMYQLVNSKGFPTLRIGTKVLINRAGLYKWIDERTGEINALEHG